jgi:hypothetical protein
MIIIQRTSPVTGKDNQMAINATNEQYIAWIDGTLIQDAMPQLSADEREFIISGCTSKDWEQLNG